MCTFLSPLYFQALLRNVDVYMEYLCVLMQGGVGREDHDIVHRFHHAHVGNAQNGVADQVAADILPERFVWGGFRVIVKGTGFIRRRG